MPILFYHTSPKENRDGIMKHGLKCFHPNSHGYWGTNLKDQPTGVYVSSNPSVAGDWAKIINRTDSLEKREMDIWEVDAKGMPMLSDPQVPNAKCITREVPPQRVRKHSTVTVDNS